MPWSVKVSGTWRTVTAPQVRVSGSWQAVKSGWVKVSGTWRQFYASLTAAASPTTVDGFDTVVAPSSSTATTNSTTVTPTGGSAPYTYSWSLVSGTSATVNSPTSATTTFSRTVFVDNPGQQINRTGVYRCTVTDSASQTATADVTVNTTHNGI